MNSFVIISFLLLGIASFVIQKKRRYDQIDALHLLFFTALAILIKIDFDFTSSVDQWTYALIGVMAVNFLLSRLNAMRKPLLRLIPPMITFGVLLAFFWSESFIYLGKSFAISNKATLVLPVLGIIMYEFAHIKISFLQKHFGMANSAVNVQLSFFIGVSVLIGAFNAQGYGVFLVAAGFLASSFYHEVGSKHIVHSFFALSLVWMFAQQNSIELLDLRIPKVMGGLFIGAFIGAFVLHIWTIQKRSNLALAICYFICAFLLVGMLGFEVMINASFGGVEAFLGALIGFALANSVLYYHDHEEGLRQSPAAMSGLVLMILVGLTVPPLLVNEEEKAVEESLKSLTQTNANGEEIVVPFIALTDLSGSHEIDPANSIISFKLGEEGSVTKGAIKEFTGSFNFSEDLTKSSFDIKLPVMNLTTFLSMRDESIMGPEYFKADKFPAMYFKGSEMKPTDKENEYEMLGTFEMLGTKKEQKVLIHRIEDGTKKVLVGSGEIDRRRFGMSDDPREGNIVSFEFKVELK